jgi:tRNA pseudouridine38-40 synthase
MRTIQCVVEYDGANYAGWQIQLNAITIQGLIEQALLQVTGRKTTVVGASRTDAGVHSIGQVAAFRTDSYLSDEVLQRALNANLPRDIRLRQTRTAPDDFHPRLKAKSKTYRYVISCSKETPFFLTPYMWSLYYPLNPDLMRQGAQWLIGQHDFSSFRASGCSSKTPIKIITAIDILPISEVDFLTIQYSLPAIVIKIEGVSFLRYMVRNIVGLLVEIGRERLNPDDAFTILEKKDRRIAPATAPAKGLFLEKIEY